MTNPQPQTPNTYKVLFVCTGNLCRSPMAAAMFNANHHQPQTPNAQPLSTSAGTNGVDGQPAHPLAQELLAHHGIDLSEHRARTVSPQMLSTSKLILTMETSHQDWILSRMPTLQGRVHLLGRWRDLEILDPMAGGLPEFQRAAREINECITDWLPHLQSDTADAGVQARTTKTTPRATDSREPTRTPSTQ